MCKCQVCQVVIPEVLFCNVLQTYLLSKTCFFGLVSCRFKMAEMLQDTRTPEASCSENVDAQLSFLPERLRKKLLPFQEKGITFALQRSGRCMIADEMGLGKTIQAIAISYYYRKEWPLLIVVPSSLRYPWVDEMEKWIPELSPDDIIIIQNKTDTGRISTSKVTVLGYGLLTSDAQTLVDTLYRQNFKVVVIDESHYMKSRNATRSKILLPIVQKAIRAILLTGTPALGRPEELFMQIEALFPRRFGTWSEYAKKYCDARLRYYCTCVEVKTHFEHFAGAVKDYIKMMLENDKLKFLVFAHHLSMLQACTEAVIENKVRYIRIDGSVPSAERIHLVNQFQKDPDIRVAILSIQAAGQGLTFTAATHVVFAELYWDPGHIKQAEDRAHRIGQHSSVNIHFLIAKGTLDPLMWAMLNRKAKVTGSTLNGKKEKMQAEEGDKEKWDFLSFAEAWTPNDSVEDFQNELFFTHFEKERQHDIRSFFSPKSSAEKKRKMVSDSELLKVDAESFEATKEENLETSSENLDSTGISDVGTTCRENSCEREAKRARTISGSTAVSSSKKTALTGKKSTFFTEKNNEVLPCSSHTSSKGTALNKDGEPLNLNFIPLDIQLDNWEDLPENFQHKRNRSMILRFVKEWSHLTAMKQKIVRKSGQLFCSPIRAAEEMSKKQSAASSTKRYVTKEDVAAASLSKASSSGGSVRLITKESRACLKNENASMAQLVESSSLPKGYLQALDGEGNPLCLRCQQPTAQLDQSCQAHAWDTRFCSLACQEDFSVRSSQSYLRTKVFEIEHGVCQFCYQNAQELYLNIRDAPKSQRKKLLESSWMSHLPLGQLNEIITNPTEGQFWQVDHIRPVYGGGGQCSLENLQTLCTVCHRERTAKQAKERSQMKRRSLATKYGCDITKFFVKK
uniref:Zinc finger RANBP2-type containing 3 n=1 Tax=Pavo cristatus TaxID=9049 RepID=A0A8C9FAG7_PAVCR